MRTAVLTQLTAALAQFSSARRLYSLTIGGGGGDLGSGGLLVEAFSSDARVHGIEIRDIIALSTNAHIDLAALLGQSAKLEISLADGTRTAFSGDVREVAMLGSEGGLARYRLRLSPWIWRLSQVRNSRVWEEKSVIEIVDSVFAHYAPLAAWRWSDEAPPFMAGATPRSYCCQYRETDLDFVHRLLSEEGLAWRFEETDEGQRMVLFADSSQETALSEDTSSKAAGGIRFHGIGPAEKQDTVQALRMERQLCASMTTLLSYDYKAKRVVQASSPSRLTASERVPTLESFDVPGQYAFADSSQARRYADLHMQGQEGRSQGWSGRSTLRTMAAGSRLTILDLPLKQAGNGVFSTLRVVSVGVNNLPSPARQALTELFGPIPELLQEAIHQCDPAQLALVVKQAQETGYANYFEAVLADVVWRSATPGSDGRMHPRATAAGSQSAIVVGADGNATPNAGDELYCDALGRVRIRFHWQDGANAGCWVRVAQRSAGGGMGSQFLPRIGQEVLVQFIENDIDRPIIIGALYNGQGEGGVAPTPGARADEKQAGQQYDKAHDHAPSSQGNLSSGNSPLWHGASADSAGHRNGAAQWGLRSKEFGANGYNQLLFDDTDAQGRVQLKSSSAASELNLGHLIHTADNYRGSLRGQGAELRTDAYGVVRAGAGLMILSYKAQHTANARDPAGDHAAGVALLKQATQLAASFSEAAATHQTVALASHAGSIKANASTLDDGQAPIKALWTSVAGMVGSESIARAQADAEERSTAAGDAKLPHATGAMIGIGARAGLGAIAGQSLQLASGDTVALMSGQDSQFVSAGQMRVQSGQAIGVLGGAVKAGEAGTGLQLIAAKDAIDVQSQSNALSMQARDDVSVMSANAHIDWAAAKKISLSTAGGANITIDGGNITVQCPGKLVILAGKKSFAGPAMQSYALPVLPVSIIEPVETYKLESTFALDQFTAFAHSSTKGEFIAFLLPVFGTDIPAKTYLKLYERLRNGTVPNAKIAIMSGGNYPAEFENSPPEIRVHIAAAERAAKDNSVAWELLAALLHEFGHYIDAVLRHELADKNPDGSSTLAFDSADDEGAKFAYAITAFDFSGTTNAIFAEFTSPKHTGPLRVNYAVVRDLIMKAQDGAQKNEQKSGSREFFPAGPENPKNGNSHGHETIELALVAVGDRFKDPQVRKQIYFGNWLRDNSQLLDPKIVRAPTDPKDMTQYFSRSSLTRIVNLMAKKKFVNNPRDRKIFEVTEARLGVYRADEHIDNPTNNKPGGRDPTEIDKDFEKKPTREYVELDPRTLMKRYIEASKIYMCRQIDLAVEIGANPDGYRHFGSALHVLEDYFAHSNFLELSLRKVGYSDVLPWTSPIDKSGTLPIVTGMFASEDVVASMAKTVADLLYKVQPEKWEKYKGGPTEADEILMILFEEHSDQSLTLEQRKGRPTWLENYKNFMVARDAYLTSTPAVAMDWLSFHTIGQVTSKQNYFLNYAIQQVGSNVDDVQVYSGNDPNTNSKTDPSHSQLAKDHDTHHFHTLAVLLAKCAVMSVGQAINKRWDGDVTVDPAAVAAKFLVHPNSCNWQDRYVSGWARANLESVVRGASATSLEAWHKANEKKIDEVKKGAEDSWDYFNKYRKEIFGGAEQVKK